jgi:hypothetical protein
MESARRCFTGFAGFAGRCENAGREKTLIKNIAKMYFRKVLVLFLAK